MKHAVYYSICLRGRTGSAIARQNLKSARSVRAHSPHVPIHVLTYDEPLPAEARRRLERLDVTVTHRGTYARALSEHGLPRAWAQGLSAYPVMHKWLGLERFAHAGVERLLYLDNDTRALDDVMTLLLHRPRLDVLAREEPFTRKSYLGADPTYFDERAFRRIAREEGVRATTPVNTGVVALSGAAVRELSLQLPTLLGYVARFTCAMMDEPSPGDTRDTVMLRARARLSRMEPLAYPSSNRWIKEQVAAWLALGATGASVGLLPLHMSLQGGEFAALTPEHAPPAVVHYFSKNERAFERWLAARRA